MGSLGSCNHPSGRHLCGQGGYLGSNKPGEGEVGASLEGEAVWLEEVTGGNNSSSSSKQQRWDKVSEDKLQQLLLSYEFCKYVYLCYFVLVLDQFGLKMSIKPH